ncbi:hypothetical protein [Sulfurimonas sp.]
MKKIALGMMIVTAIYAYNHAKNSTLVQNLAYHKAQTEMQIAMR